jgi:hypothetical protein
MRELLKTKKNQFLKDSLEAFTNAVKSTRNEMDINNDNESTPSGENQNEEQQDDEWLSYYMFGKIKEKLKSNIFECLDCYLKVF